MRQTIIYRPVTIITLLLLLTSAVSGKKVKAPAPWRIHKVTFSGNTLLKRYELLNLVELKPLPFRKNPRFSKGKMKADLEAIRRYYQNRGYLSVSVTPSEIVRDSVKKRVKLTIGIEEGIRTYIGGVTYSGWVPDSVTLKKLKCRKDAPLVKADLQHDEHLMKTKRREAGFLDVMVITRQSMDSAAHRVKVDFYVKSGSRIVVDTVSLTGVRQLKPEVILRELNFKKGDTLTSRLMKNTERKLYRTNLLNSVTISHQVKKDSETPQPDSEAVSFSPVTVACKETNFFRLKLGAGYGSEEKVRGSVETSYSNLFRLGHRISLKGNVSQILQQAQAIYSTPWFLGIPLRFDGKVYYNRFSNTSTYEGGFRGITLSLEKPLTEKLTLHFLNDYENVLWLESEGLPEDYPVKNTQSFGVDLIYDTRDDLMDPEEGVFITTKFEVAGLVVKNTNRFLKFTEDIRWYRKIREICLASGLNIGWVRPYGKDTEVPLPSQFYAGGSKSVRGFRDNYLRIENDSVYHAKSGLTMITANCMEIRFPIYGYLNGALFLDAGYLTDRIYAADLRSILKEVRWTAGPGLRLKTPIAILRTDLGFKLNPKRVEDLTQWHFDIGQAF